MIGFRGHWEAAQFSVVVMIQPDVAAIQAVIEYRRRRRAGRAKMHVYIFHTPYNLIPHTLDQLLTSIMRVIIISSSHKRKKRKKRKKEGGKGGNLKRELGSMMAPFQGRLVSWIPQH